MSVQLFIKRVHKTISALIKRVLNYEWNYEWNYEQGVCFHNLHKLAKMAIFPKNPRYRKKNLTSRMLTQPPKFSTKNAHGYLSKSKMRSHFMKRFMMNKTTFHTGTKGHLCEAKKVHSKHAKTVSKVLICVPHTLNYGVWSLLALQSSAKNGGGWGRLTLCHTYIWYARPPPLGVRRDPPNRGPSAPICKNTMFHQRMPPLLPGYPSRLPVNQSNCGV